MKDVLLLDVTPLTLGIETLGGVRTPLIERNTTIPTSKSQVFSTASDNQPQVEVHVLQGEREMAGDNKSLGKFILDGILPAPRGMPQIEVTFDIDANGILNVRAVDQGTGKEQKITITAASGLSDDEVERMKQDAELHAEEDQQRRASIELRNVAESTAYRAEKLIGEQDDKLDEETKATLQAKIQALRDALAAEPADDDAIQTAMDDLNGALMQVGEKIYGSQEEAASAATSAQENESSADESGEEPSTVEGEFREV